LHARCVLKEYDSLQETRCHACCSNIACLLETVTEFQQIFILCKHMQVICLQHTQFSYLEISENTLLLLFWEDKLFWIFGSIKNITCICVACMMYRQVSLPKGQIFYTSVKNVGEELYFSFSTALVQYNCSASNQFSIYEIIRPEHIMSWFMFCIPFYYPEKVRGK
jgi:hypothetical protein